MDKSTNNINLLTVLIHKSQHYLLLNVIINLVSRAYIIFITAISMLQSN